MADCLHRRKSFVWLLLALSLTICSLTFLSLPRARRVIPHTFNSLRHREQSGTAPTTAYLHLIVPASSADENLCKTLYSAAILGYPSPVLVNWEKKFEDESLIFGGSHIAKIAGVLEYLRRLEKRFNSDIVLLVDGLDVWFQLRPSVLLQRYHAINKAADADLATRFKHLQLDRPIKQRVIVAAQKRCWPKPQDHPACWAVPNSTLPADTYGSRTDQVLDERDPNPYENVRPRFLNSGMIMGEVSAVRALFERAEQKTVLDSNFGSDQSILAEIFGEQEFQRGALLDPAFSERHDPAQSSRVGTIGMPHEFGIGLDYRGELVPPTVFSEFDSAWIKHDQPSGPQGMQLALSEDKVSRLRPNVSADIAESRNPLDRNSFSGSSRLEMSWNSASLHTNILTGISPVAVHHNAHREVDGVSLKHRRVTHWNETWFFPHLRPLLTKEAERPDSHIFELRSEKARTVQYWNYGHERAGVYIPRHFVDFESLEDICRPTHEEVLRDGQGEWQDPRRDHRTPHLHS